MNIDRMCRVCEAINGLKDIFDEDNEELLHMLRRVADISIKEDDLLPKQICDGCTYRLQMAYEFKMLCEMTDEVLRARLKTGTLSIEAPETPSNDTGSLTGTLEIKEELIVESKSDLDSIVVKEEARLETGSLSIEAPGKPSNDTDFLIGPLEIKEELIVESKSDLDSIVVKEEARLETGSLSIEAPEKPSNDTGSLIATLEIKEELIVESKTNLESIVVKEEYFFNDELDEDVLESIDPQIGNFSEKRLKDADGSNTYAVDNEGTVLNENDLLEEMKVDQTSESDSLEQYVKSNKNVVTDYLSPKTEKTYTCPYCSTSFTDFDEFNAHKSGICDNSFANGRNLREHMENHSNERKYACDKCPMTFKTANALNGHKRRHKQLARKRCQRCGNTFTAVSSLKRHERLGTCEKRMKQQSLVGQKKHVCEICGKMFYQKSHWRQHIASHSEERKYACDVCPKKFKTAGARHGHKRQLHQPLAEKKKHVCEICGKKFYQKGHWREHMESHSEERKYACNVCAKKFKTSGNRNEHERRHIQQNRKSTFSDLGNLKRHERLLTIEKPYACNLCSLRFNSYEAVVNHEREKHTSQTNDSEDETVLVVVDESTKETILCKINRPRDTISSSYERKIGKKIV